MAGNRPRGNLAVPPGTTVSVANGGTKDTVLPMGTVVEAGKTTAGVSAYEWSLVSAGVRTALSLTAS